MSKFELDGHKMYWHLDRVAAWQRGEPVVPIYLEISPVSYCNHNCVFCALDFAQGSPVALDADLLQERIAEMGRLGVKSIMFAGEGEPLLHPRIVEIIRTTKQSGIDVSLTTNGMCGNTQLWDEILPHLTWVRFSIDAASPETYAAVHNVEPAFFELTLQSLRAALAVKRACSLPVTVGVQYLMIRQNSADVESAIELYSSLEVDYLSLKPYSEHPQMLNKSGFNYSEREIERIDAIVRERGETGKTAIIFRKAATEAYSQGTLNFFHCRALPFWGYISSQGDFYTCSVYLNDERFRAGSIKEQGMAALFDSEKRAQSLSFAENDLEIGHECRLNCRMARINEFLEFLSHAPDHVNFI
jgi:GTP 3',8-cyclase